MGYTRRQKISGKTARNKKWDYSSNAVYHIVINAGMQINFFGEMKGNAKKASVELSVLGQVAEKFWKEIPEHYPNVSLGACIIMPNHLHGILYFTNPNHSGWNTNTFGPQKNNLGKVIGSYKAAVTKYANEQNISFFWHRRYHDTIIKSEEQLKVTEAYILRNPENYFTKRTSYAAA